MASPVELLSISNSYVAICHQHGGCFVASNLDNHLRLEHQLPIAQRRTILTNLIESGLATHISDIATPTHGSIPISGLPIVDGFQCISCHVTAVHPKDIAAHCRTHGWSGGGRGSQVLAKDRPWTQVQMQTLWREKKYRMYFTVNTPNIQTATTSLVSIRDSIRTRFDAAQPLGQTTVVPVEVHVAEVPAWLRRTQFHIHLAGLESKDIGESYSIPKTDDNPILANICNSVERVLRRGMIALSSPTGGSITNRVARFLNTFTDGQTAADPMQPLQNNQTRSKYIATWKKLVCYFIRTARDQMLVQDEKPLFEGTASQLEALETVTVLAHMQEGIYRRHEDWIPARWNGPRVGTGNSVWEHHGGDGIYQGTYNQRV